MSAATDVLRPELVLVSPPEVAARARRLLADPVPVVTRKPAARQVTQSGLAFFYAACIAGTLGPFLLAILAR